MEISEDNRPHRGPEARRGPVIAAWLTEFERLRRLREPTLNDLTDVTWNHYQAELEADRTARTLAPSSADIEAARADLQGRAASGAVDVSTPLAALDACG